MAIISTILKGNHAEMVLSDDADREKATYWVEFRVRIEGKDNELLGANRLEALLRARQAINEETRPLAKILNQNFAELSDHARALVLDALH